MEGDAAGPVNGGVLIREFRLARGWGRPLSLGWPTGPQRRALRPYTGWRVRAAEVNWKLLYIGS